MKFLELFSGIGGMHVALKESGLNFEVALAADINEVANQVYAHNFPNTKLLQKNIQSLDKKYIDKLGIDGIVMSPPCQPFTRLGNKKDLKDQRCCALSHLINLIPEVDERLKYIVLENVKGFEVSEARDAFTKCLKDAKFDYREFLLTPLHFGIPNSRLRYYLIARRNSNFTFEQKLMNSIPGSKEQTIKSISEYLDVKDEDGNYNDYILPMDELKKRVWVLDIVNKFSQNSCCFTKSYGRYAEGTGSFYSPLDPDQILKIRANLKSRNDEEFNEDLKSLRLRYFTPEEVKGLMCFNSYSFPDCITRKQTYALLGNSVNVKVVSEVIKCLISE